jgi:uncharacterized protein YifE (UPF0438 family)
MKERTREWLRTTSRFSDPKLFLDQRDPLLARRFPRRFSRRGRRRFADGELLGRFGRAVLGGGRRHRLRHRLRRRGHGLRLPVRAVEHAQHDLAAALRRDLRHQQEAALGDLLLAGRALVGR